MKPARYGPFYHRAHSDEDAYKIEATGELWGWPRWQSSIPQPQAFEGPLPEGAIGIEFYTDVEPTGNTAPHYARWCPPAPGIVVVDDEYAKIRVVVTKNTHRRPGK